ncbi:type I restriction-modification system subunit M N-terminal domain-containing protein [Occultella kanbiaonis]|uniref:type I restriction-modification system subunit M N-terminal domain-containing protein n=1 Tax=Occultella kanbiaonis TaxID=2675754 RepID=UPI001F378911|nr:type I restriction-modification system subunit M N-terminal domain-containing protein [Occultella kanbiaonis]
MISAQGFDGKVAFIWKVADRLRGTFKQHEYGAVMLPLLLLRRLDAVLEPTSPQLPPRSRHTATSPSARARTSCSSPSPGCRSTTVPR